MRKLLICSLLLLAASAALGAEPLVLEQAGNVLKQGTLEAGLANIAYQTDETKLTDNTGAVALKMTNATTVIPLYARYAFTPVIEGFLTLPYASVSSKNEPVVGAATDSSDSGLADPTLAGKYSFACCGWDMAGAAFFSVPMGKESTKMPSAFKQGFDIRPLLAARKAFGNVTMNANLSYDITGEYTDENKAKQNPGDVLSLGVGAEFPCPMTRINWIGEFIYDSLSESSTAGVAQSGSSGSRMELVLGGRYNTGALKTKLGIGLSLGDEKYRAYDYRVIAGVTYLVQL